MTPRRRILFWLPVALVALFAGVLPATAADYTPTPAEAAEIQRLSAAYVGHLDQGAYDDAYAMYTAEMRQGMSPAEWRRLTLESRQQWGALEGRTQTGVTWYLDPPKAPRPGLYVAVDYASRYANLAAHTEYLVWYRGQPGQAFELMRHESNAVGKDATPKAAAQAPLKIEYRSVEAARTDLLARKDLHRSEFDGWLVFTDPANHAMWWFPPVTHPAYPSMILRSIFERDGTLYSGLDIKCGADKTACDALAADFRRMNEAFAERVQQSLGEGRKP
jgi:hypothetical protein